MVTEKKEQGSQGFWSFGSTMLIAKSVCVWVCVCGTSILEQVPHREPTPFNRFSSYQRSKKVKNGTDAKEY